MTENIFNSIKSFFEGIRDSPKVKDALRICDFTIQFRVVDKVPQLPPNDWFFQRDGEWYYVDIKNGVPSCGKGDVRNERDWRFTVPVYVEKETLRAILDGRKRVVDAVFENRFFAGNVEVGVGATAAYATVLLTLGQSRDKYWNYLHNERKKSFMKKRYAQYITKL